MSIKMRHKWKRIFKNCPISGIALGSNFFANGTECLMYAVHLFQYYYYLCAKKLF